MKNTRYEHLRAAQKLYHRQKPWRLTGGLFIPHCYTETMPDDLSWWDDVGFILNGRRVIVWWRHPRHVYTDTIDNLSWVEAGDDPHDDWILNGATPNHRKLGRSRKKVVSYTCRSPSEEQQKFYDNLRAIRDRLTNEGVDASVEPSYKVEWLDWAIGVHLVAPFEIRCDADQKPVAALVYRLLTQQSTLESEFPGFSYTKQDWLNERKKSTD